jgi:hypothetical protein
MPLAKSPPAAPARRADGWDNLGQAVEDIEAWAQTMLKFIFDQLLG